MSISAKLSLSKVSAAAIALSAMVFGGAAFACDYCNGGYSGGGREVYSCNAGMYDCRYESATYNPRIGDCNDGCHGGYGRTWDNGCGCYRARVHAYAQGYRHGFRDGYETATYEGNDGFYDDDHHWRRHERWQDGDGHWRDGWHDDKGGWHDREFRRDDRDGGWRDGDRRDDHDWHDGDHRDDHHDGDWHDDGHHDGHDGDHHDDHRDGDHHVP